MCRSELYKQGSSPVFDSLAEMCGKQLGHLKHRDLIFAEDGLEFGVRVNIALIRRVLKAVCLDVFPYLFCNFGPRQGRRSNDGCEFC